MNRALTIAALSVLAAPALGQGTGNQPRPTLEQTFRELSQALQEPAAAATTSSGSTAVTGAQNDAEAAARKAIVDAARAPQKATPENWLSKTMTAITTTQIPTFVAPDPTASVAATIAPGTSVQVGGIRDGFVQLTPLQGPNTGITVYTPEGLARASFIDTAKDTARQAANKLLEEGARAVAVIQKNDLLRVKGFKLTLAAPPSLEIDIEMKDPPEPTAAAAPR